MVNEKNLQAAFVALAGEATSPDLRIAANLAATGGADMPVAPGMWSNTGRKGICGDALAVRSDGYIHVVYELKRSHAHSLRAGAQRVNLKAILKLPAPELDLDARWWRKELDDRRVGLTEDSLEPHTDGECVDLPCRAGSEWEHELVSQYDEHENLLPVDKWTWRVGMPQPPAYLFTQWWANDYWSDGNTLSVVLGGDGGFDPVKYYDSWDWTFGKNLNRFVMTPHAVFLDRLAVLIRELPTLSREDMHRVRKLATLMWIDATEWENQQFSGPAHDLVYPNALNFVEPWIYPEGRYPCPCRRCVARRS